MELIASFAVDHTNLRPGIYISRRDKVGEEAITTYDIRMTSPNREPAINIAALHSIEHIVATYLRNHPEWKDRIVYWGPMGCLTGNYLLVKGEYPFEVMRQLMIEAFTFVVNFEGDVPGSTPATCGNYLMHDLPMARFEARRYVERLKSDDFCCEYPKVERPIVEGEMQFFDA